jgi:hypothetical protein
MSVDAKLKNLNRENPEGVDKNKPNDRSICLYATE